MGQVLVIGAGLGGLTLAHALVRAGIDAHVPEAARTVNRQVLRRILLSEPGDRVTHGKRLAGYAEGTDGIVTAYYRPMPSWPVGHVTLLGDAAHLTLASDGGHGAR